jgi:hypothetical protein
MDLVVQVEEVPLRRRARRQAAGQPPVQRPLRFVVATDLLRVLPPFLQVAPAEAARADVPVVDQTLSAFVTISMLLSMASANRMSGLSGEGKMRFFGVRARPALIGTTLNTG